MNELPWIAEGRKHIGLREDTSRTRHNATIVSWLDQMGRFCGESKAWWRNDDDPWCGLFVGYTQGVSGRFVVPEWYRARSWESEQLTKLSRPAYGCIITFTRKGGGHVGYVVGIDQHNNLMVLGANQGNAVSIAPFAMNRVSGYYWPSNWTGKAEKSVPAKARYDLPLVRSGGKLSTNEA